MSANSIGQNRCKIRIDNKFGFIDTVGNIMIQPSFIYASQFSEGYAVVRSEKGTGFIDTNGVFIIQPNLEGATQFKNGLAVVYKNDQCGLINISGKLIIDYADLWLTPALINENRIAFKKDERWGYKNYKGETIIDNKFESVSMFRNGTARIQIDGQYGVIDTLGNYILEPTFVVVRGGNLNNNRIGAMPLDRKGYCYFDKSGNKSIDALYSDVSQFSEGLAFVKEKYGEPGYYIDTTGTKVFNITFDNASLFKNDLAVIEQNGKKGVINKQGDYVVKPIYDDLSVFYINGFLIYMKHKKHKTFYGLINVNGEEITKPIFSNITFNDGDCPYGELYKKGKDSYDKNTLMGYCNREGKMIWKPKK